jgi:hypothetical protein
MIKTIKNFLLNFLLVVVSLVVALTFTEIVLRFTDYSKLHRYYGYPRYHFEKSTDLGYDIAENFSGGIHELVGNPYPVFSNRYRCFDQDVVPQKDYWVIVGDSYTWGYTPLEKKWTTFLQEKSGLLMMKCGVTGYGTKQEFIKAKKVINQVGHAPKYIIVLYTGNDLNDDMAFPQRTVVEGYLVGRVKGVDLVNGKVEYNSDEYLISESQKFLSNTFSGKLRKFRYSTVLYNLYMAKFKPFLKSISHHRKSDSAKIISSNDAQTVSNNQQVQLEKMPDYMTGFYSAQLVNYWDNYDIKWYNDLIDSHKKTIKKFVDYSNSIGAKLLLVDMAGNLDNERFKDVLHLKGLYYYNLTTDYPISKHSNSKQDGHWDARGNQEAGYYMYQHFKKFGIFK